MSPRLLTILRTIGTVMLLWFVYRMLERVHTVFVLLAIVISSTNVIILWMTRYHGKAASDFSRFPLARKYVELVCRLANMQQPCHPSAKHQSDHWLCQTDHDYLRAVRNLQQSIRGHDETIAEIVGSIKNSVKLRSRRRNKPGELPARGKEDTESLPVPRKLVEFIAESLAVGRSARPTSIKPILAALKAWP